MSDATEDRIPAEPYSRADLERNIPIMARVWFGAVLEPSDVISITEDLGQRFGPEVLAGNVGIDHIRSVIRDHIPAERPCQTYRIGELEIVELNSDLHGLGWTLFNVEDHGADIVAIQVGLSEQDRRRVLAEALTEMVRRAPATA